jgi:lipopolysaccharide export system permease protein
LQTGALGDSIKVGEFTTHKDRMALRIEQSRDEGRQLMGIFARFVDSKGQLLSISAREGRFLASPDRTDTIILRLTDGTIVQDKPGTPPRVLSFTQHDLPIDLPAVEAFRRRGLEEGREYVLPELLRIGWGPKADAEARDQSQANFNFRIVEVVMMLLLPLLAVALAIPPKRSSSALGVFVSIVMVVAYHKVNQYGESIASLGRVDPFLALWGPFALFSLLIFWMYWRVAYIPGGQAIGALESVYAKLVRKLKALWRRRQHIPTMQPAGADAA